MGRQIAVALTDNDESELLAFLRGSAPIALFEAFAPTREALSVSAFAPREEGHWSVLRQRYCSR